MNIIRSFTLTVKYVFLFIGAVITDLSFMPSSDYQCSIHIRCEIYLLIHICCEMAKKRSPLGDRTDWQRAVFAVSDYRRRCDA